MAFLYVARPLTGESRREAAAELFEKTTPDRDFYLLVIDPVFISFESNLYVATAIAVIAGAIAAYGLVRSKVGGAMTGIGIAVSLMPPLVAAGIGLADMGSFPVGITFAVFLLNVVGIIAGSAVMFLFMKFHKYPVAAYSVFMSNSMSKPNLP